MLLAITAAENADDSPAPKSRPDSGGSAAAAKSPGIIPAAAGASTVAHSAPRVAGTSSSAHAANTSHGRSAIRCQYPRDGLRADGAARLGLALPVAPPH